MDISLNAGYSSRGEFKRKWFWLLHPWCGIDYLGLGARFTIGIRVLGVNLNFDITWNDDNDW